MLIGEIVGDVSTDSFTFEAYKDVKKFDFVAVKNPKEGKEWILAQIDSVTKSPEGKIEAEANIIGFREKGMLKQPRHVIKPDSMVYRADEDVIAETLGLRQDGLYMGRLETNPDIRIFVNPSDLYKHIAVLAQTGAGKCVAPDTPVLMADGRLQRIQKIFEEKAVETVKSGEDEELVRLEDTQVQALDDEMSIGTAQATFAYRKKAEEVVEITTASGRTITVSREHPLLCADGFTYREAANLEEGDAVAIPRRTRTTGELDQIAVDDAVQARSNDLIDQRQSAESDYEQVMRMHENGERIGRIVEAVDTTRSTVENWVYQGYEPEQTASEGIVTDVKGKQVAVPAVTSDLGEFFALLIAEGTEQRTSHYRAMFTNNDNRLLDRFEVLCEELFGLESQQNGENVRYVDANALETVLNAFGYKTNQRSRNKAIPDAILAASTPVKRQFLETYADCEGGMEDHELVISTASENLANQLVYLLLGFDITARIREKEKQATNADHGGDIYYEVTVSGVSNLERFAERIGFGMERKQEKLVQYVETHNENTNVDVIPVDGNRLREERNKAGLSQRELADIIGMSDMIISRYENENRHPSREALEKISEALDIQEYKQVCQSDVQWDKITDISVKDNPHDCVYDLTVKGDHTFVAGRGGIINHNSYATGVMLEELLEQNYPVIVIDPHGEYHSLAHPNDELDEEAAEKFGIDPKGYNCTEYSTDTDINPSAERLAFSSKNLEAKELDQLIPTNLTNSQLEVLYNALKELKDREEYTLDDIIDKCMNQDSKAKWNLVNVLEIVQDSNLFADDPTDLDQLVERGHASIINLKGVDPENQEMVVYKLAKELFNKRKVGKLDPFIMIMEEAHNFVPESNLGKAVSSDIMRTIASEGRKFGMGIGVISQRPANVNKNILSQCNTQLILRVTNPNDLNAISRSFEGVTKEVEKSITSLPPGTGLVLGKEYPVMTNIRTRRSKHGGVTQQLTPGADDDETADAAESQPIQPDASPDTSTDTASEQETATVQEAEAVAADTVDAAAPEQTETASSEPAAPEPAADTGEETDGSDGDEQEPITALKPAVDTDRLREEFGDVKTAYYPLWIVSSGKERIAVDATDGEIKARDKQLNAVEEQVLEELQDGAKTRGNLLENLDISLTKLERTLETLQEKSLITEDDDAYTTTGVALFEQETEPVTGDDHTEISTDVSEQDAINIAKNELTNAPNDITKLYYPYYTAGKRVFDGVTGEEI